MKSAPEPGSIQFTLKSHSIFIVFIAFSTEIPLVVAFEDLSEI